MRLTTWNHALGDERFEAWCAQTSSIREPLLELLREMASLIGELQAFPRRNALTGALQENGRLVKTIFVARYLQNEDYRRRIGAQLNKGEALHALRAFLFFANEAKLRTKQEDQHASQAGCLNLVTNAVVAWNTVYVEAALNDLGSEGVKVEPEAVAHLSPARHGHINPYGRYRFDLSDALTAGTLRPLRTKDPVLGRSRSGWLSRARRIELGWTKPRRGVGAGPLWGLNRGRLHPSRSISQHLGRRLGDGDDVVGTRALLSSIPSLARAQLFCHAISEGAGERGRCLVRLERARGHELFIGGRSRTKRD